MSISSIKLDILLWRLLFLMFAIISHNALSKKPLKIGVAQFPPYAYKDENGKIKGLEVEILQACFKESDFALELVHFPYGRLPIALKNKSIDGQITTLPNNNSELFFSKVVAPEYHAVAISLAKNKFNIKSIDDLKGKSIVGHQRASTYYGKKFENIVTSKKNHYKEYADQLYQLKLLFNGLTDVIVIGENIFHYFRRNAYFDASEKVAINSIFGGKRGYHNAFYSLKARNHFDKCLIKLKKSQQYNELVLKEFSRDSVVVNRKVKNTKEPSFN